MAKKLTIVFSLFLLAAACGRAAVNSAPAVSAPTATATPGVSSANPVSPPTVAQAPQLSQPITNALSRVTKKHFGTYVAPGNSTVFPERFLGYHTGVDFETTPEEQKGDVPVFVSCAGKLLLKEYASGFGGVAVQSCRLDNQDVTIVYGHLRLSSIIPNVGDTLTPGQQIAVLGTGYSSETDGERQNLHFGIHKGTAVDILGYVPRQSELSGWLNPLDYLTAD